MKRDPDDAVASARLSGEFLQRLRQSGDSRWLKRATEAAEQSVRAVPAPQNPAGLSARARAHFASHQFKDALADAEKFRRLHPGKADGFELLADAQLELNELASARQNLDRLRDSAGESLGWHVRMARLAFAKGDGDEARVHFDGAVAFAKEAFPPSKFWPAWALVQRGGNLFAQGEWVAAELSYAAASDFLPGAWFILDRMGELRAAQGRWDEAIAAYRKAIEGCPLPWLKQALGDVFTSAGRLEEAKPLLDAAEADFLASANAGEAIFFHHLAAFYADSKPNPVEAENWARKDLEIRRTPASLDGLAWALYRAGKFAEAATFTREALAAGAATGGDTHVLYHSALILLRADEAPKGAELMKRAADLNPGFGAFHAHR